MTVREDAPVVLLASVAVISLFGVRDLHATIGTQTGMVRGFWGACHGSILQNGCDNAWADRIGVRPRDYADGPRRPERSAFDLASATALAVERE